MDTETQVLRVGLPPRSGFGGPWRERQDDPALWDAVLGIPDEELWAVRQSLRGHLFRFVRERARTRWIDEHVGTPRIVAAGTLLDPSALTIGFARRFTGYKRPELVFTDAERLARILNASGRPVQIIFAGKSHPADDVGKHHLQRVFRRALDPAFGGRVAFLTTTICTSRISSCRAATCGSTRPASRSKRAARAA